MSKTTKISMAISALLLIAGASLMVAEVLTGYMVRVYDGTTEGTLLFIGHVKEISKIGSDTQVEWMVFASMAVSMIGLFPWAIAAWRETKGFSRHERKDWLKKFKLFSSGSTGLIITTLGGIILTSPHKSVFAWVIVGLSIVFGLMVLSGSIKSISRAKFDNKKPMIDFNSHDDDFK